MRSKEFFEGLRDLGYQGDESLDGVLAFFRVSGVDPLVLVEAVLHRKVPLIDEVGRVTYGQIVGNRVAARRAARGASRDDIVTALGVSVHAIRSAETAFNPENPDHIKIAEYLGVSTFDPQLLEEVYR